MTDMRCCALPGRGIITVSGEEQHDFLQRLVTADIGDLTPERPAYACLLSPKGFFLHDFFVIADGSRLILECEGGARAEDLCRRLMMYKLRAQVTLELTRDVPVWAVFGDIPPDVTCYPDPRHTAMGWRSFDRPVDAADMDFETWDRQRIACTLPDGSRDMTPEKSNIIEMGLDRPGAVSIEKGCFVGQELIARMLHRGLAKKHLYTIQADSAPLPVNGEAIRVDGKMIGTMATSCDDIGLAVLKDDALDQLPAAGYSLYAQEQAQAGA